MILGRNGAKKVEQIKKKFLFPSDLFVNKESHEVTTLLGTCVAITLWDSNLRIGGINHYLLPTSNGQTDEPLKYGDTSIVLLIKKMKELGSKPSYLIAKIFGGTDTLDHFKTGFKNIEMAKAIIKAEGIKVSADNTGGDFGRKIMYYTQNGDVYLKYLNSTTSKIKTGTDSSWTGVCPNKPFCNECRGQTMINCILQKTIKY